MSEQNEDVVRRCFASYLAGDRQAAENLISEDFVFTSPQDDRIDRAAYFERCFPTADRFAAMQLLYCVPFRDDVFVLYEYELRDTGKRYLNTEVLTLRDGQVVETQVFFGGRHG